MPMFYTNQMSWDVIPWTLRGNLAMTSLCCAFLTPSIYKRKGNCKLTADFISPRGNFIKMMKTPYSYLTAWTMYATEFKGSIYITNWPVEEFLKVQKMPEMDDISKWGHVFKHYMRGGDPEDGVDANEEYRVVLKNKIGHISLLYPVEVDCVDPDLFEGDFKDMEAFVLTKSCKELTDDRLKRNFKRFKLNHIWCENKLAGIPRTIVGYRAEGGIVHSLELLKTDKLPEISKDEWDPNVCLNFLVMFLNFVKERVHSEPGTTFKFDREAKGHSIYCSKLSGLDHINMLPSWYIGGLFAEDSGDKSWNIECDSNNHLIAPNKDSEAVKTLANAGLEESLYSNAGLEESLYLNTNFIVMSYYYRGSRPMVSGRGRGRGNTSRGRGRGFDSGNPFLGGVGPSHGIEFDPKDVFQIRRPETFSGNADVLHKPHVLGSYSVDSERDFGHDRSMLHFLDTQYIPENGKMQVQLDLKKGWDKFNRYTGNQEESFQCFLKWILNNQECVSESKERLTADFISARGNFTKLMRTPYNFVTAWTFYATEFKGSVYIINWPTEEELKEKQKPVVDDISKWGHVFEHYMKGGDPEAGVDANEEYRVVLKNKIGEISLLYAPEVDCVDPERFEEDFKDMEAFVLVKCCRELTDSKRARNHKRFKLNQLWCENQLAGIPRTILGYRNDDGIVHTLELLETEELPEISEGEWDPNVCLNFLVKFLNFVKERVHREPGTTFKFDREARGHIYCSKLSGIDHINMLPSWYTDGLFAEDSEGEED
ncbi:uncharacterized protein [Palaemon carinicauda]|uniref:uncharacterized protein n=1 Tax=Palaemon carinicauda TaxID=392227 RepID=UPI0035B59056